ncbi:hypothetical protein MHBO_003081 [Bonamia ostreae]|uniref:Uncharacterized protein n=1 Tax=Bonamia ostreae TaxID=126728 RepID=A0ABV2AQ21_9EUKA
MEKKLYDDDKSIKELMLTFPRRSVRINLPNDIVEDKTETPKIRKTNKLKSKKIRKIETRKKSFFKNKKAKNSSSRKAKFFKIEKYFPKEYYTWNKPRKQLWKQLGQNPDKYYYLYCAPGQYFNEKLH